MGTASAARRVRHAFKKIATAFTKETGVMVAVAGPGADPQAFYDDLGNRVPLVGTRNPFRCLRSRRANPPRFVSRKNGELLGRCLPSDMLRRNRMRNWAPIRCACIRRRSECLQNDDLLPDFLRYPGTDAFDIAHHFRNGLIHKALRE